MTTPPGSKSPLQPGSTSSLPGPSPLDLVMDFFETVFTGTADESPARAAEIKAIIESSFNADYTYNGKPFSPDRPPGLEKVVAEALSPDGVPGEQRHQRTGRRRHSHPYDGCRDRVDGARHRSVGCRLRTERDEHARHAGPCVQQPAAR